MNRFWASYFASKWRPALVFLIVLACMTGAAISRIPFLVMAANGLFILALIALLGVVAAAIWNLLKKRWSEGIVNVLMIVACAVAACMAFAAIMFASLFGPSEDGFADELAIPEGLECAIPDPKETYFWADRSFMGSDAFQSAVRNALAVPGNGDPSITPAMPSLRKASTDHAAAFLDYLEASPDWHVFFDRGNRFAARRWSYNEEPQETLHGYISEFGGPTIFQTRCLLCLDRRPWSRYAVQHIQEGVDPSVPEIKKGNDLYESRVMIECGGVWVELFEQSDNPERRVTKATIKLLEEEFASFLTDPEGAVESARSWSIAWTQRFAGGDEVPFRLVDGLQPGIYDVVYFLNPGEPGTVYLKAYEVTRGTPLSVNRLKARSATRMAWSTNATERFAAKSGFTIYEGDWGKPYAARFEVWFEPDSGASARKLAERVYKIEGWQR